MPAPDDDDRDDALLRRLYADDGDADGASGELAREVERYRTMRGAIADYARATDVEPPSRGLDELMAAARARVGTRTPIEEPTRSLWDRLRGWLAPHPALASAAMLVVVAGVASILYVKGNTKVAEPEAAAPIREPAPVIATEPPAVAPTETLDDRAPTLPSATPERGQVDLPRKAKPSPSKSAGGSLGGALGSAAVGDGVVTTETGASNASGHEIAGPEAQIPASPPPPPPPAADPARGPTIEKAGAADDDEAEEAGDADRKPTSKPRDDGDVDVAQLTRQARTAAKSGDCGVVKNLAGRVQKADVAYYQRSFAADVEIKKCL